MLTLPLWSQADDSSVAGQPNAPDNGQEMAEPSDARMHTPPVVSGESYSAEPAMEERSNYLRAGMAFTSAYGNNAFATTNGKPVSEMNYSVYPTIALDQTTSRLHSVLTYAPGFTFYQQTSYLNASNQNASIDVQYRLTPHLTLNGKDSLQKSSSVFNQSDFAGAEAVGGGAQEPNFSVIAPAADFLRNAGNAGFSDQFAQNQMVGASGTFSSQSYSDLKQVSGLYDSRSQAGSAFYSFRASRMHYLGATYQYQRLLANPGAGLSETQTHAVLLFYTLYPSARFTVSFFGGPQHSDTVQPPLSGVRFPASRAWNPAAGTSLSWQGRLTGFAFSYSHIISGGSGLMGAVHMDNATMSLRQQVKRSFSGSLSGSYVQNDVIGSLLAGTYNGHTLSGTLAVEKQFRTALTLQLGYTRLRQDYTGVAVLSQIPNTNREFVSLSYSFSRPLGR